MLGKYFDSRRKKGDWFSNFKLWRPDIVLRSPDPKPLIYNTTKPSKALSSKKNILKKKKSFSIASTFILPSFMFASKRLQELF